MPIEYEFKTSIRGRKEFEKFKEDLEKLSELPYLRMSHKERAITVSLIGPEFTREKQEYSVFDAESIRGVPKKDPICVTRTFVVHEGELALTERSEWDSEAEENRDVKRYDPPEKLA